MIIGAWIFKVVLKVVNGSRIEDLDILIDINISIKWIGKKRRDILDLNNIVNSLACWVLHQIPM